MDTKHTKAKIATDDRLETFFEMAPLPPPDASKNLPAASPDSGNSISTDARKAPPVYFDWTAQDLREAIVKAKKDILDDIRHLHELIRRSKYVAHEYPVGTDLSELIYTNEDVDGYLASLGLQQEVIESLVKMATTETDCDFGATKKPANGVAKMMAERRSRIDWTAKVDEERKQMRLHGYNPPAYG
jgi:hypothetical protein